MAGSLLAMRRVVARSPNEAGLKMTSKVADSSGASGEAGMAGAENSEACPPTGPMEEIVRSAAPVLWMV